MKTVIEEPEPFLPDVELEVEAPIKHLVLCLHGILSVSGDWASYEHVTGRFRDISVTYAPVSYMLTGISDLIFRRGEVERRSRVERRIEQALAAEQFDSATIICHSYGTKLFSSLSSRLQETFDWIFFVGSICHIDDDERFEVCKHNIINECGINDPWPIVLAAIRPKTYWHTGVIGFNNYPIKDRYFPFGHSMGVHARHFESWVLPVLRTHEIRQAQEYRPGRWRVNAPYIVRGLGIGCAAMAVGFMVVS